MHPYLEIGSFKLPLYTTLFLAAFAIAVTVARKISYRYGVYKDDVLYASIYGILGLFVGAKLFYFISKLPLIIRNFDVYMEYIKTDFFGAMNYSFGGLVFYGGLIGMIMGMYIYCRQYKVEFVPFADILAPLIPGVHGVGRIGCFFAGCCYGKEYHGFGSVRFPENEMIKELDDVPRIPVQLIEAFLNFIMCGVLFCLMYKVKMKTGQLMGIYIIYYSIIRIIMEFMRGDEIRGDIAGISTSQIISIILFPIGVYLACKGIIKGKKKTLLTNK